MAVVVFLSPKTWGLDEMIEEATVDCYGESEEATGLFTMLDENLALPFKTVILGVEVTVRNVDITERDEIVALCRHGRAITMESNGLGCGSERLAGP